MNRLVIAPLHYFYSHFRDPLPASIPLDGGYTIAPLTSESLAPAFDFFADAFSKYDHDDLTNCSYAVYFRFNTADDASSLPQYIASDLIRIVQTLRVVKRTRAMPATLLLRVSDPTAVTGEVLYYSPDPKPGVTFYDRDEDMEHFVSSDAATIQRYWHHIKKLSDSQGNQYHRVLNTLNFFELGHTSQQYKPRLVNLVTALESLFNTSSEQLSLAVRIRCAYFLEPEPDKRIELAQLISAIYKLRSKFVHGQPTGKTFVEDFNEQKRTMMETENIDRRCLQRVFDDNLVAVFGRKAEKLQDEFMRLELGATSPLAAHT